MTDAELRMISIIFATNIYRHWQLPIGQYLHRNLNVDFPHSKNLQKRSLNIFSPNPSCNQPDFFRICAFLCFKSWWEANLFIFASTFASLMTDERGINFKLSGNSIMCVTGRVKLNRFQHAQRPPNGRRVCSIWLYLKFLFLIFETLKHIKSP